LQRFLRLRSRDGERIEIGGVENRGGHPVLVGGVGGLNGPELAEWLNRARLGLSSGEVARIIANPPKPKPPTNT